MKLADKMKEYNLGTPQNLDEYASIVLLGITDAKIYEMHDNVKAAFRDYISQSFGAAMMLSESDGETERLKTLFAKLISNAQNSCKENEK